MRQFQLMTGLTLMMFSVATLFGANIYVAPDGTPTGDGSKNQPFDIFTVFSETSPAQPGDVLILKGGQYDGPMNDNGSDVPNRLAFNPKTQGTADNPILVTSAPGESAHLNGTVEINGCDYTHFVRLEIGDLLWDPLQLTHINLTAFNATVGESVKLINCNVFGGAMGTGLWRPALNFESYGNLIHDFGYYSDTLRGSGHAAYIQNDTGTKTLEHNIAYRGCGWNFDIYTQDGEIKGFDILENIASIASWHKPGQVGFNYGLAGYKPAERIRFIGNIGYQSRGPEQTWRSNMRLIYHSFPDIIHNDAIVKNNYIMGSWRAFVVSRWNTIEISGNTFWGECFLTEISSAPSGSGVPENPLTVDLAGYTVTSNTYIANGNDKPFILGSHEPATTNEMYGFADWQALDLDQGSTMLPGKNGRPTGTKTFVFPNRYENGRANVAIFAWDGQASVDADLSQALTIGQTYKIYNCLDVSQTFARAQPVLIGAFDGTPVTFPMKHDISSPDFDVFIVLPDENLVFPELGTVFSLQ